MPFDSTGSGSATGSASGSFSGSGSRQLHRSPSVRQREIRTIRAFFLFSCLDVAPVHLSKGGLGNVVRLRMFGIEMNRCRGVAFFLQVRPCLILLMFSLREHSQNFRLLSPWAYDARALHLCVPPPLAFSR